jgi:hypothetical protein
LRGQMNLARAAFVALAGLVVHGFVFYPGWLSFDSAYQLWQARHYHFNNLSPVPVTLWLATLQRVFNTDTGAALFIFHLLLFWAGCALSLRASLTGWSRALLALMALAIVTPLWWTLANVWTDTAVLAGYAAGVGLIAFSQDRKSRMLHNLALVFLLYGSIARLNALPAAAPLFLLWWITRPNHVHKTDWRAAMAMLGLVGLSFAIGTVIDRTMADERVRTWPVQVLHDLAGVSITTNTMYVPDFARDPELTIDTLRTGYTPYVATPVLLTTPALRSGIVVAPYSRKEAIALLRAWLDAIAAEPSAYLRHRLQMMDKLLLRPDRAHSYALSSTNIAFRDNPQSPPFAGVSKVIVDHLNHFGWRIQFSFAPYLVLFLVTAVSLYRKNIGTVPSNKHHHVATALLVSAALYVLPLLVLAPAADVRYLAWAVAAICLASWTHRFAPD